MKYANVQELIKSYYLNKRIDKAFIFYLSMLHDEDKNPRTLYVNCDFPFYIDYDEKLKNDSSLQHILSIHLIGSYIISYEETDISRTIKVKKAGE